MKYSQIRNKLKTGDVILFSGKGGISDGIKFFSRSIWSHVAIVYKIKDKSIGEDTLFCWESTTLNNIKDAETGKLTKGVQRVELSERLEKCFATGYKISIRQLSKPLDIDMLKALNTFREEVKGKPYEKSTIQLIKAAWDGLFSFLDNKEDLSSLFCSELLAAAYQKMGLLGPEPPSNEYIPKDFSKASKLQLLHGYSLNKEIVIEKM